MLYAMLTVISYYKLMTFIWFELEASRFVDLPVFGKNKL